MNDTDQKKKLFGDALKASPFKRVAVAAAVVAVAGLAWYSMSSGAVKPRYVTQEVATGNLRVTVSADGTLEPVRTVSIGSELSGIVSSVNVDVNSTVKVGDVLIELDKAKLISARNQAKAALETANAKLSEAKATAEEARAKMRRYQELNKSSGGKLPSRTELDVQRATVKRAEAGILTARASIDDAKATLETSETNLSKASIKSPVDGVVLTRSVEPGYAVAASLQAVELLTVATDLHELQLKVDVDEADVGQVHEGQTTTFTVSAYPNQPFPATLTKVAYGASTGTDKVVTYTTYLAVKNADLKLRSGMTATATIETARRENVMVVPNTALRFQPETKDAKETSSVSLMMAPPRRQAKKNVKEKASAVTGQQRTVYVLDAKGNAVKKTVTTGLTDGSMTEVVSGELSLGDKVIINQLKKSEK